VNLLWGVYTSSWCRAQKKSRINPGLDIFCIPRSYFFFAAFLAAFFFGAAFFAAFLAAFFLVAIFCEFNG